MSFVASKNSQCHFCGKTVYAMEKMDADGKSMHKACFKCEHCQCVLKLGNFAAMGGRYFCKPHFKQLFKEKGNYHSGFGSEDAKSKWAPQAVVYGAPGANFMKASGSEWDSRQTKSFRMPRPRTDADIDAPKSSTLTLEPKPPPRESLAQLASVGALKSVGERWGSPPTGPAADASRDQRRRAALEARKSETDSPISPRAAEKDETPAAASPEVKITPAATPSPPLLPPPPPLPPRPRPSTS
ncbi:LIM domain containing protein [Acanthamoeba castellanii str. Neff]|uniref:LIM domain containing protein n=1 Tax=Acanthamoeba castellanii (strain ATCC 30010 / Neff) TaxID=1257118 RepID=L8H4M5_ACACF|nr:LIM domain containing protein [Acanthamoeba castellanii str. Neff]ELR20105.1 LIM domain containing protein [Acanthamoeba castellanii str. Neff]